MDAKHKFWEEASRIAPENALLATNTSGLLITEVAKPVYRPERFMGQHWLNPPPSAAPVRDHPRGKDGRDISAADV